VVGVVTERSALPDELHALLVLERLTGVGPRRMRSLIEVFGSATAALRQPHRRFSALAGEAAARERDDPAIHRSAWDALETAQRRGMTVLTWSSAEYPESLRHLADPPPLLFALGRLDLLSESVVTIVGARRATARARDFARRLAAGAAARGVSVASGMALGVDGSAHLGALDAEGSTVAVLGTGVDVPYPRSHRALAHRIEATGLLVSELPPGTPALSHHFPRRNRILAALARQVVVVEAGARSGSLITVDHALDLGREVWAVPGPVGHAACEGSNALLVEGARPLLSVEHFLGELGRAPSSGGGELARRAPADEAGDDPRRAGSGRSSPALPDTSEVAATGEPVVEALLTALAGGPLSCDVLAARLGLTARDALVLLTRLELGGVVRRLSDLRYGRAA